MLPGQMRPAENRHAMLFRYLNEVISKLALSLGNDLGDRVVGIVELNRGR